MIGVLVEVDTNFTEVWSLTEPVLDEYCRRHGYLLNVEYNMHREDGIFWSRIHHMLSLFDTLDWLVHMDADVLITNLNVPLEEFCEPGNPIILSENTRNDGRRYINDGVFFVQGKSKVSRFILQDCLNATTWRCDIKCPQNAFEFLRKFIKIEPQKRFNSHLYEEYGMPTTTKGQWTKGDFILHTPGVTMKRRLEILPKIEIIR